VAIAGPSGVGKSHLAQAISAEFGERAAVVQADAFLRQRLRGEREFRSDQTLPLRPADFDADLMVQRSRALAGGKAVLVPRYEHGRGWSQPELVEPQSIVILEGLFTFGPALAEAWGDHPPDLTVYVEADEHLLMRWRRVRDVGYRTPHESDQEWQRVRAAWYTDVIAARAAADVVIRYTTHERAANVTARGPARAPL
jgi:uridine kinase